MSQSSLNREALLIVITLLPEVKHRKSQSSLNREALLIYATAPIEVLKMIASQSSLNREALLIENAK